MRDRSEIESSVNWKGGPGPEKLMAGFDLVIELLLDIRDLLAAARASGEIRP